MKLTALTGMPVSGTDGEKLGEVEELIVDVREGAIEGARLQLVPTHAGQALRIFIPWSQLRCDDSGLHLDIGLRSLIAVASRRTDMRNE